MMVLIKCYLYLLCAIMLHKNMVTDDILILISMCFFHKRIWYFQAWCIMIWDWTHDWPTLLLYGVYININNINAFYYFTRKEWKFLLNPWNDAVELNLKDKLKKVKFRSPQNILHCDCWTKSQYAPHLKWVHKLDWASTGQIMS